MDLDLSKYTAANVVHPFHPNSLICSILCGPFTSTVSGGAEYQCNVCGEILDRNFFSNSFVSLFFHSCSYCRGYTLHRPRKESK